MVAKVFLLLLVVAAEYTIVLGYFGDPDKSYFGDRNIRYFGDRNNRADDICIQNCKKDCGETCTQQCVTRVMSRRGELLLYRDDKCVEECGKDCSGSCSQKCVTRNSRQEEPIEILAVYPPVRDFITLRRQVESIKRLGVYPPFRGYRNHSRQGEKDIKDRNSIYHNRNRHGFGISLRNDDVCLDNCNKDCGETCTQQCVTRVMSRRGELLLYRDDKCVEKCSKDCSSSCTQKCVTRSNNIPVRRQEEPIEILAVYPPVRDFITPKRQVEPIGRLGVYPPFRGYRNHSRQGEDLFPVFGEDDRNGSHDIYQTRNHGLPRPIIFLNHYRNNTRQGEDSIPRSDLDEDYRNGGVHDWWPYRNNIRQEEELDD